MSDNENRKSMDDVLASIRRIVRAEKQPDAEQAEVEDGPMPQEVTETGDEPLALTPDMRMQEMGVPDADPVVEAAPMIDEDQIRAMVRDVLLEELGGEDADAMIRTIIRDELTTGQIGGNISKNVLKLVQSEVAKAKG